MYGDEEQTCDGPTCDALVIGETLITCVDEARNFFGEDLVWRRWDEDWTCPLTPSSAYGPHAPKSDDCLCALDVIETARRAGYRYTYLDNETWYFWSTLTRPLSSITNERAAGMGCIIGMAIGFALAGCLLILLPVMLESGPSERFDPSLETAGRFNLPLPRRFERDDVQSPLYLFSCPKGPPEACDLQNRDL